MNASKNTSQKTRAIRGKAHVAIKIAKNTRKKDGEKFPFLIRLGEHKRRFKIFLSETALLQFKRNINLALQAS